MLSDINMPLMNGLKLLKEYVKRYNHACNSINCLDKEEIEEALSAGINTLSSL
jgi:DNA-binding NarL/FixJ family response regulator